MNVLEKRCVELSYKHRLTHISSVLNTLIPLRMVYARRQPLDPVVLGNSHAALALFVVLESLGHCDAEEMVAKHGTHAARDMEHGVWVSGGSLGQAETVAVGMALADRDRNVWLVTSDGACAEGSVWEAFRLAGELRLKNLQTWIVANGYGGYGSIDVARLIRQLSLLTSIACIEPQPFEHEWLHGLAGHYTTLNEDQYQRMMAETAN